MTRVKIALAIFFYIFYIRIRFFFESFVSTSSIDSPKWRTNLPSSGNSSYPSKFSHANAQIPSMQSCMEKQQFRCTRSRLIFLQCNLWHQGTRPRLPNYPFLPFSFSWWIWFLIISFHCSKMLDVDAWLSCGDFFLQFSSLYSFVWFEKMEMASLSPKSWEFLTWVASLISYPMLANCCNISLDICVSRFWTILL